MSQIIAVKLRVTIVSQEDLIKTLDKLSVKLQGFTYSVNGTEVTIHYAPIDLFRKNNLQFKREGTQYKIYADPYTVKDPLNKVLTLIQVGYNMTCSEEFFERYNVPTTVAKTPEGILMRGVLKEEQLVALGAQ